MRYVKSIDEFLFELFINSKPKQVFFRKSRNPDDDLIRNFSCYHNGYFDEYDDALKYFKEEAMFSQPIKQDPITKKWCGHVESGLCGYIVRDEDEFYTAMYELNMFPHLDDIKEISVFYSDEYYLEDGSDGEDTFRGGEYLFSIKLDTTYHEYLKIIKNKIK